MSSQKKPSNSVLAGYTDSIKLFMRKCVRPSRKEFVMLARSHAIGICFLGVLGYAIKLIHIPINNIIVNKPDK